MMEYLIGTPRVKKNLNAAYEQSIISAQKGCLYAKMINYYTRISDSNKLCISDLDSLYVIAKVIPFAQVLICDYWIRTGHYARAIVEAQNPITKGHPAATFVLCTLPDNYDYRFDKLVEGNQDEKNLTYFYFVQKALRLSPYKGYWIYEAYNADKDVRKSFEGKDNYLADSVGTTAFWTDVLVASHNFGAKLEASIFVKDTSTINRLALSALADLNENSSEDAWNTWMILGYGRLTRYEQLKLILNDSKMNSRAEGLGKKLQANYQPKSYFPNPGSLHLEMGTITLLDECNSLIEDFRKNYNKTLSY